MGYVFIISTARRDRHNTSLNVNGWKLDNYRANPIVLFGETPMFGIDNVDAAIGTSRVWLEDGKLMAEWAPDPSSEIAAKLEKKLKAGTSLGASVKFIPIGEGRYGTGLEAEGGKRETFYYSRQELIAWKMIAVPSNPDCIYVKNYKGDYGKRSARMRLMELQAKYGF